MQLCIMHRIMDLYCGGAEVVMKNFIDTFPQWRHVVVFNYYYDTWLANALEQMPNVRLYNIRDTALSAILAAEAPDVRLVHWYPSLPTRDVEEAVEGAISTSVLYSHWFREPPLIDGLHYWFVAPSARSATGGSVPDERCRVIINPVAEKYFRVTGRPVHPVIGRHSSTRTMKFSPRFFDLHEAIPGAPLQVKVMGCASWLREEYETRRPNLKQSYSLLPLNSTPATEFLGGVSLFVYRTDPRLTETCPMVILEAMAAARPIVAEDRGGISDLLIDRQSGFLCTEESEFIEKIDWCNNNPHAAVRMGERAREWARAHASMGVYRNNIEAALAAL